jgi:hypothetical protein
MFGFFWTIKVAATIPRTRKRHKATVSTGRRASQETRMRKPATPRRESVPGLLAAADPDLVRIDVA